MDKYSHGHASAADADAHGNPHVDADADKYTAAIADHFPNGHALPVADLYTLADGYTRAANADGDANGDALTHLYPCHLGTDATL